MAIKAAAGTKIWIGPATTASELSEFQAIDEQDWVELGEVENLGEFGDQSQEITFESIGDSRTRRSKGSRDAGVMQIVVGADPQDPGQLAFEEAERTEFEYAIRIEENDAPTPDYSNSVSYFRGLVMSRRKNIGTNNNIVRRTFNVAINTEVFELPASLLSS